MTEIERNAILDKQRAIRAAIADIVHNWPGTSIDLDYPEVDRAVVPIIFAYVRDGGKVTFDGSGRVVAARIQADKLEVEVVPQDWPDGDRTDLDTVWTTIPSEMTLDNLRAIARLAEYARDRPNAWFAAWAER